MLCRPRKIPSYRHYKPKDLGVVRIDGKDEYLGKYDSPESWERYHRRIAEWLSSISQASPASAALAPPSQPELPLSINELLLKYWHYAQAYYVKNGKPTKELACMKEALRPLRQLYGRSRASEFGPKALKAVQQHMVEQGLSRGVINHRTIRIKRMFKWATAEELIPPAVFHALQAVGGLRHGHTTARETEPVKPVPPQSVEAVLPYVAPQVAAMVRLQQLTGMRPCEVTIMRSCDIDRSGDVWVYEPHTHKNRWRGHRRLIPLGPKAQGILMPFLDRDAAAYLFSPKEAEAWRRERRAVHHKPDRKTPIYPSELRAREKAKLARRRRKPKRPKRDHYDTDSYRRAIDYGLKQAKKAKVEIPHWHPHQLRHSKATEVRKQYGIEAAQVVLGHARADVTEVYAERNLQLGIEIAREAG